MPEPFLILTLPRAGSYHLVSLLGSAPDLVCHGEIYKAERVELAPELRRRLGLGGADTAARDAMGAAFVQALEALSPRHGTGFKAFPSQLRGLAHRDALLFGPGRRRVLLRRDPLAAYLSQLRARATGIWTLRAGAEAPPPGTARARVRFCPEGWRAHLGRVARFDDLCARISAAQPGASFTLDHADLDRAEVLDRLLAFLGSRAQGGDLRSDRLRQYHGPLEDGVENPEEMRACLARDPPGQAGGVS